MNNRELLEYRLTAVGWVKNRFGHFHKVVQQKDKFSSEDTGTIEVRLKMQKASVKLQRKMFLSSEATNKWEWATIASSKYSKVEFGSKRIKIGTMYINNTPESLSES